MHAIKKKLFSIAAWGMAGTLAFSCVPAMASESGLIVQAQETLTTEDKIEVAPEAGDAEENAEAENTEEATEGDGLVYTGSPVYVMGSGTVAYTAELPGDVPFERAVLTVPEGLGVESLSLGTEGETPDISLTASGSGGETLEEQDPFTGVGDAEGWSEITLEGDFEAVGEIVLTCSGEVPEEGLESSIELQHGNGGEWETAASASARTEKDAVCAGSISVTASDDEVEYLGSFSVSVSGMEAHTLSNENNDFVEAECVIDFSGCGRVGSVKLPEFSGGTGYVEVVCDGEVVAGGEADGGELEVNKQADEIRVTVTDIGEAYFYVCGCGYVSGSLGSVQSHQEEEGCQGLSLKLLSGFKQTSDMEINGCNTVYEGCSSVVSAGFTVLYGSDSYGTVAKSGEITLEGSPSSPEDGEDAGEEDDGTGTAEDSDSTGSGSTGSGSTGSGSSGGPESSSGSTGDGSEGSSEDGSFSAVKGLSAAAGSGVLGGSPGSGSAGQSEDGSSGSSQGTASDTEAAASLEDSGSPGGQDPSGGPEAGDAGEAGDQEGSGKQVVDLSGLNLTASTAAATGGSSMKAFVVHSGSGTTGTSALRTVSASAGGSVSVADDGSSDSEEEAPGVSVSTALAGAGAGTASGTSAGTGGGSGDGPVLLSDLISGDISQASESDILPAGTGTAPGTDLFAEDEGTGFFVSALGWMREHALILIAAAAAIAAIAVTAAAVRRRRNSDGEYEEEYEPYEGYDAYPQGGYA